MALPAGLLCLALGLMLAFAPRRALVSALATMPIVAMAASFVRVDAAHVEVVYVGCWISVVLLAGGVHLRRLPASLAMFAACDAGLWSGLLVGDDRAGLSRAIPAVLVAVPGAWLVRRRWAIALKVASSWLVAIAVLAALLPTTPTPGYMPDHMD